MMMMMIIIIIIMMMLIEGDDDEDEHACLATDQIENLEKLEHWVFGNENQSCLVSVRDYLVEGYQSL